ncbi:MAG: glycosyl hydrolase 2 galactose-binding domain-containing protein, partial [Eubacterium sp.]
MMNKINLAGDGWIMKNCTDNKEYPASIPGSDFGNLIKNSAIKNPLISGDEKEGIRTGENDIEFKREFIVTDDELKYSYIHLCCGGLDTLCTCYINGKEAFKSNNAFIPVDAEIKDFLTAGKNSIIFHFSSAVKYIKKRQTEKPLPKNNNGVDGIPYIRKPACHFGWDWGPCVPYCAVTDFIEIKCFDRRIENIEITQNTAKEKSVVKVTADNADKIYIVSPNGNTVNIDENNSFIIDNPELWYTYELSQKEKQPLYTIVFENDEERVERKIGLRSLYLDRSDDEYGSNFCFVLNGERIFAKGANLIPFSAIYEDSNNDTVDYYLDLAQKSNFNIIRIWGGGSYASDYLINQCDERGILV